MCQALEIHPDLTQSVQDASLSIVEIDEWFRKLRLRSNPLEIQHRSMLLQYRCFAWLLKSPKDRKRRPIEDCVAVVVLGLLSIVTVNRERGFTSEPAWMHSRLKANLLNTSAQDWAGCPIALFWVLAIGAIRSEGYPEQLWFVVQLREACRLFSVGSLDSFISQMQRMLWFQDRLSDLVPRLWDKIQDTSSTEAADQQTAESKLFAGLQAEPSSDVFDAASRGLLRTRRDSFREFIFDESEADGKCEAVEGYHTGVSNFLLPGTTYDNHQTHRHPGHPQRGPGAHHAILHREMTNAIPHYPGGSTEPSPMTDVPPPLVPSGASDVSSPSSTEIDYPTRSAGPDSAKYSNIDTALLEEDYAQHGSWNGALPIMQPDPFRQQQHKGGLGQELLPPPGKAPSQPQSATFIPRSHPQELDLHGPHRRAQSAVEFQIPNGTPTPTSAVSSDVSGDQHWMQSPVSAVPHSAHSDSVHFVYPPPPTPQRQAHHQHQHQQGPPLLDADWLYRSYNGH